MVQFYSTSPSSLLCSIGNSVAARTNQIPFQQSCLSEGHTNAKSAGLMEPGGRGQCEAGLPQERDPGLVRLKPGTAAKFRLTHVDLKGHSFPTGGLGRGALPSKSSCRWDVPCNSSSLCQPPSPPQGSAYNPRQNLSSDDGTGCFWFAFSFYSPHSGRLIS